MSTLLKKFGWKGRALLALLALLVPIVAYAAISTHNLDATLRTQQFRFVFHRKVNGLTETATTIGQNGTIWAATISANRTPCTTVNLGGCPVAATNGTDTGTIASLPYPARLAFSLIDRSSNSAALSCTQLNITGMDLFGARRSEVFTTVNETQNLTTYAYEKLEFAKFTGCTASTGVNSDDFVRIYVSEYVGLPFKIGRRQDIISICRYPYGAVSNLDPRCLVWNDGDEIVVDTTSNTIRLTNDTTANTPAGLYVDDLDEVIIRARGKFTYP